MRRLRALWRLLAPELEDAAASFVSTPDTLI